MRGRTIDHALRARVEQPGSSRSIYSTTNQRGVVWMGQGPLPRPGEQNVLLRELGPMKSQRGVGLFKHQLDRACKVQLLLQLMDPHFCRVSQGYKLFMERLRCSLCLGNGLPICYDILVDTARLDDRDNPLHLKPRPREVAPRWASPRRVIFFLDDTRKGGREGGR